MKRAAKWIAICVIVGGMVFIPGKIAIRHFEKEANIGLAAGDLHQLWLAWRIYAEENEGESPRSIQDLIDAEILNANLFEYNGKSMSRAIASPEIIYNGLLKSNEPERSTILARQQWSETVELILYASGKVERKKSPEMTADSTSFRESP
jgi:hypothetical protein